jgi:hypothetical protein
VNKWMVRFWGLLALASLAMLVATTAWPVTPNPQPALDAAIPEAGAARFRWLETGGT